MDCAAETQMGSLSAQSTEVDSYGIGVGWEVAEWRTKNFTIAVLFGRKFVS
jgi:hypothetical protein